jgi:2-isopropylmalate synthase
VINLPDTVGYALPVEYVGLLNEVRRLCPALASVTLSAHCHDDLGLAVANSLAAIEAGAGQIECTINGIGERAGNAALEEIVMALRVRRSALGAETGIDTAEIGAASRLVERLTGYGVPRNKAIVGANAFAHEAGIHQDGLLKDLSTYQIMDPGELGVTMTLPLGKHSGRHAFASACTEAGIELSRDELTVAFRRFKALADHGRPVGLDELFAEVTA